MSDSSKVAFTIFGEPASKANSRMPAMVGKGDQRRTLWIKSQKALAYESQALIQIPAVARVQFDVPVKVTMRIWYASERPDLDESLILDILQDRHHGKGDQRRVIQRGVYVNDRLVREKHVYHGIDARSPRVEIEVEAIAPQQARFEFPDPKPSVKREKQGKIDGNPF